MTKGRHKDGPPETFTRFPRKGAGYCSNKSRQIPLIVNPQLPHFSRNMAIISPNLPDFGVKLTPNDGISTQNDDLLPELHTG